MADYLIGRLLKRGTPMASGSCTYNSRTGELRSTSDSWFQHDPLCKEAADAIAARDAEIARLRAEVADLLPMLDADAMTISNQQAEIDRLSHRAYELAVAIMGGEDAPGYADSVDTETLVEQMRQSRRDANRADDRAALSPTTGAASEGERS